MSLRSEIEAKHLEALTAMLTAETLVLARYVLRNALLEMEILCQAQQRGTASVSLVDVKTNGHVAPEVFSEAGKAPKVPATELMSPRGAATATRLVPSGMAWGTPDQLSRLDPRLHSEVGELEAGNRQWGAYDKEVRLTLLQWILKEIDPTKLPTMSLFDKLSPQWTPSSSGIAGTLLAGRWSTAGKWWAVG